MTRLARILARAVVTVACLAPVAAAAQPAAPPATTDDVAAGASRLWLVAGGAFSTLRGDCQTCEEDYPYRHAGSVLANVGYRVTNRMDAGLEVFWMPVETESGNIRATHFDAIAQFRPWASQGFFVKGGAGMAFIRNWVDTFSPDAINSKMLSVVIGTGWAFYPDKRIGMQLFASQHAGAVGDLQTASGSVPDVIGNFWSLGAAFVIR